VNRGAAFADPVVTIPTTVAIFLRGMAAPVVPLSPHLVIPTGRLSDARRLCAWCA
jgi:hypothetical protein